MMGMLKFWAQYFACWGHNSCLFTKGLSYLKVWHRKQLHQILCCQVIVLGNLIMGLEGWGIDKWTVGGLCFILQSFIIGFETNLKVIFFFHCEIKSYLHLEGLHCFT
jgi:hypothetical protein